MDKLQDYVPKMMEIASNVLKVAINIFLGLFFAILILNNKEELSRQFKKLLLKVSKGKSQSHYGSIENGFGEILQIYGRTAYRSHAVGDSVLHADDIDRSSFRASCFGDNRLSKSDTYGGRLYRRSFFRVNNFFGKSRKSIDFYYIYYYIAAGGERLPHIP